jgi:Protein of unknown function (DUF3108)
MPSPGDGERARRRRLRFAVVLAAATSAILAGADHHAQAQSLDAHYTISMTGIRVGKSAWTVNIDSDRYSASANGGSVDLLNVLLRGEGVARVSGSIKDSRLVPATFSSSLVEDGVKGDLKMTLEDGIVTAVEDSGPPPASDRVPLTQLHVQGVTDPLTALLLPDQGGEAVPAKESCERTLAVFDGRRRYDLALSFKRVEKMQHRPEGEHLLVCNVVLRPIAGHRADSMIMKYVAGRRDMEISFAPIAGTRFLAPFRLSLPTLIGTMAVQATSFETPAPAPAARQ